MAARHKILLAICFVGLAVGSWFVQSRSGADEERLRASTYSTGPRGAKALYLALEELRVHVKRFRRSLRDLTPQQGTLVIYDPKEIRIGKREGRSLRVWLGKGNRLLMIQGRHRLSAAKTCTGPSCGVDASGGISGHFGLALKRLSDEGRAKLSVAVPEIPVKLDVSVAKNVRWEKPDKQWNILLEDASGPILLSKKVGKGEVLALSDPTVFSNQHIREKQNLRFALALLLGNGRPSQILFDEYHHGHPSEEGFWSYVGSSVFSWILFQAAVGLALFFYSVRGEYAGRFRSLSQPRGRSSMEYIQSMANVLESCKAGSESLEVIVTRFVGQVSRRFGVPVGMLETGQLKLDGISSTRRDEAANLIVECRKAIKSGDKSDVQLALARKIAKVRREVIHAGRKHVPVMVKTGRFSESRSVSTPSSPIVRHPIHPTGDIASPK